MELPGSEQQGEREQRLEESSDGRPAHQQADQPVAFPSLSGFLPIGSGNGKTVSHPQMLLGERRLLWPSIGGVGCRSVRRWPALRRGEGRRVREEPHSSARGGGALRSPCANGGRGGAASPPPRPPPGGRRCLRREPGREGFSAPSAVPLGWSHHEVQLRPLCSLLSSSSLRCPSEEVVSGNTAVVEVKNRTLHFKVATLP